MGMDSTKYGGIERFNIELAKQLYEKGYRSVFVYEEYPVVQTYSDDLIKVNSSLVVLNSRKNKLKFCMGLWNLMKMYNVCAVHAHFTKARFYAIPLALLYGIKNITYTLHSRIDTLDKIKLHTRFWYWWMNRYCKVVAVSKQIEETAKSNWENIQCKTLYLGVNEIIGEKLHARKLLNFPTNHTILSCIANFNHIKGLDVLVKAVKLLADKNKINNIKLYIIGQPQKDQLELQSLIDKLQLSQYIQLEGIRNNVSQYLLGSDIYVQPSRSEGLPLSLMECCSVGLPIVASNVGGIPEIAQNNHNAILFDSENEKMLADNILQMIENTDMRVKYSTCSKEIFKTLFSIETNVANLIDFYNLD